MTKSGEEGSERKRLSIPKVDESVLQWWNAQHDPGLSVRMLIRGEIERNGITDVAFRPVAQQPRRGRPPGTAIESADEPEQEPAERASAPARVEPGAAGASTPEPPIERELVSAGGFDPIDALMNG